MARPRQGDELKRTIRRRGDKLYAYEMTSVMENGKKKTVSRYLGRVDPETNELMEKVPEKSMEARRKTSEQRCMDIIRDVRVADFGATYFLDQIQRKLGMGEDLDRSFGNISAGMLAIASALLQSDRGFGGIEGSVRRTWIRDMYGLEGTTDSDALSDMAKSIGIVANINMDRYFGCRVRRSKGIVAWISPAVENKMSGEAEDFADDHDDEEPERAAVALAADSRGVPVMYRICPGNGSDMDAIERLASDMERLGGGDAVFVMGEESGSAEILRSMIGNGHRFAAPAAASDKAVRKLLAGFRSAKDAEDLTHDGHAYTVWKTEIGIAEATGKAGADASRGYAFTLPGDEGHASEGKLAAYVCFDSEKYSDEVQRHTKMIYRLKRLAERIDAEDPVAAFREKAGKAMRYFDAEADGRKVRVAEKPRLASFEEKRAGLSVVLASEDVGWKVMMAAFDAKKHAERGFGTDSKGRSFPASCGETMDGREFLEFLGLTIAREIEAEIREAGMAGGLTVEEVISCLNCIRIREYHGTRCITGVDNPQRKMLEAFDVPVPQEARSGQPAPDAS